MIYLFIDIGRSEVFVRKSALSPSSTYLLVVKSWFNAAFGMNTRQLIIVGPPSGGHCGVTPPSGWYMRTFTQHLR